MANILGKIYLPPAPKWSVDKAEAERNLEQWTREVERAVRAFERTTNAILAKTSVTGSRGGNAALASLLTALATAGIITDNSS
jgi:hypothetical protein